MNKRVLFVCIGLFQVSWVLAHNMFCLTNSLIPYPEPEQLKCFYHYRYNTRDGKTCYIQFTLGGGINLVPQSTFGVSPLAVADLGTIAIKADIFGIEDKKSDKAAQLQSEGFKGYNRFTMSNSGIPLAIKFEPDAMPAVNVNRLFNRESVPGNMTLEQLQAVIGLGRVADDLPDLINKMQVLKINGCSVAMPPA